MFTGLTCYRPNYKYSCLLESVNLSINSRVMVSKKFNLKIFFYIAKEKLMLGVCFMFLTREEKIQLHQYLAFMSS